jgi:hypothetical protein
MKVEKARLQVKLKLCAIITVKNAIFPLNPYWSRLLWK